MSGLTNLAVISPAVIVVAGGLWLLARLVRPVPVTIRPAADPAQHRAVLARYGVSTSTPTERSLTLVTPLPPAYHPRPDTRRSTAA